MTPSVASLTVVPETREEDASEEELAALRERAVQHWLEEARKGRPCTGAELGRLFGMSAEWGRARVRVAKKRSGPATAEDAAPAVVDEEEAPAKSTRRGRGEKRLPILPPPERRELPHAGPSRKLEREDVTPDVDEAPVAPVEARAETSRPWYEAWGEALGMAKVWAAEAVGRLVVTAMSLNAAALAYTPMLWLMRGGGVTGPMAYTSAGMVCALAWVAYRWRAWVVLGLLVAADIGVSFWHADGDWQNFAVHAAGSVIATLGHVLARRGRKGG